MIIKTIIEGFGCWELISKAGLSRWLCKWTPDNALTQWFSVFSLVLSLTTLLCYPFLFPRLD